MSKKETSFKICNNVKTITQTTSSADHGEQCIIGQNDAVWSHICPRFQPSILAGLHHLAQVWLNCVVIPKLSVLLLGSADEQQELEKII